MGAKPSSRGKLRQEPLPAPYLSCVRHFASWAVVGAGTLGQMFNQPSDQSILNSGCRSRSAAPAALNLGQWAFGLNSRDG